MSITTNYLDRVGHDISAAKNVSEALELADLNFTVELEPISRVKTGESIPRNFGAFRQDTGECFGVNGTRYKVCQTADSFNYVDKINEKYPLTFHRGGLLKGGRYFISALFDKFSPNGDLITGIAAFVSSFDGSYSNRIVRALKREICLNVCVFGGNEFGMAAKHTSGADIKIDKFMEEFIDNAKQNEQIVATMQRTTITQQEALALTKALFGSRESKQVENQSDKIMELFTSGIGNNGQTAWDWFNGVSEFETHHFTRRNTEIASADENAFDAILRKQSLTAKAYGLLIGEDGAILV